MKAAPGWPFTRTSSAPWTIEPIDPAWGGGDGKWLNVWTESIHDLVIANNYTDCHHQMNRGKNCPVTGHHLITDQQWPAERRRIVADAGPEAAFRDMKAKAGPALDGGRDQRASGRLGLRRG